MIRRFFTSREGTSTAEKAAGPGTRRSRRSRPALESLEGRQLLSLGGEMISPVNTTLGSTFEAKTASSFSGNSVVVWVEGDIKLGDNIRAQRFDAGGHKIGPELLISSGPSDFEPSVAINDNGLFVVSWTEGLSNGDTNVVARLFNFTTGAPLFNVVPVGAGTFKEHSSVVAMNDNDHTGQFTVAYVRDTNNNNPDVFAKQYNFFGNLLDVVNVATTSRAETSPSIAMLPDGRFDVAWVDAFSNSEHDIQMNTYTPNGVQTGTFNLQNNTTLNSSPSVAMDYFGNSVVAWSVFGNGGGDIRARRVSAAGIAGPVINIASSSDLEGSPSVAIKPSGGSFVVAYDSDSFVVPSKPRQQVMVAEVSPSNFVTTLDAGQPRFGPAVSIDGFNNYMVVTTALDRSALNIHARRGHLA
jgi:hypothetical protein